MMRRVMIWRFLLRPLLFLLDPERAHHLSMALFSLAMKVPPVAALVRWWCRPDASLARTVLGVRLASPVGLAAGFDKDARWYDALGALGFGFVEVGTLTGRAQPGNEKPRLFRLTRDKALLNRFGFNNRGAHAAAQALAKGPAQVPLAVNIGRSKVVPNEEATADYLQSLEALWPHARWFVVNVSSPNTPGLRALQDRAPLTELLTALVARNRELAEAADAAPRPMLVKIAPDLSNEQVDDVVALALEVGLDGIVATNTTLSREGLMTPGVEAMGAGGVSGAPLTSRSRGVVARIRARAGDRLVVVGAGGVMTPDDAAAMLEAGADLVQVYTGFIYGGPLFVRAIHQRLLSGGTAAAARG